MRKLAMQTLIKRSLVDDILKPSLASGEVALSRLSDGEILELLEPSGDFPENVLPNSVAIQRD